MKKVTLILIAITIIISLSACGNGDKTTKSGASTSLPDSSNNDVALTDSSYDSQVSENNQVENSQVQQSSERSTQANANSSDNIQKSTTSTDNNKEQTTINSSKNSSIQDNTQSSVSIQQKIAEENTRHENVINKLNQKKQDILSLRDARFNALGTSYSGTEEEYLAKQSELRNRSSKLQLFISSCRGSNLSQSTQKKLRDAKKEKEAVDAELSALESSMSVKRLKEDIENQTKDQIDGVEKEMQAENDLHAQNLASIK